MSFEKARQERRLRRRFGPSPAKREELARAYKGTIWWGINRHTGERVEAPYEELVDGQASKHDTSSAEGVGIV